MIKKIIKVCLLLISLVMILSACQIKNIDNNKKNNSIPQTKTIDRSSQPPLTEIDKLQNSSSSTQIKSINLSIEDIKKYLNNKKSKIMKMIKGDKEEGTVSVVESHMMFPSTFVKSLGVTFVFPNDIDDLCPTYIYVVEETNTNNTNFKGAKSGMNFKDIMSNAGKSKVMQTWMTNEANIYYKVDYIYDGIIYSFISDDENGTDSELYISLSSQ